MERIATATAEANKFGGGKNGFRDGDLGGGITPTQLEAEWFDQVQEEIAAVIEGFGVVLNAGDKHQMYGAIALYLATKAGLQAQTYTAFTTGGTSTAFTLTPTPALTGLAAGQRFRVKFHTGCGATPTLAISGQAAKSLKKYTYAGTKAAVVAADIVADMLTDIEYDGVDYVVLDQLPGDTTASIATDGYQKLPSGWIIQWGTTGSISSGGHADVTFPITFPNGMLCNGGTTSSSADSATPIGVGAGSISASQHRLYNHSGATAGAGIRWWAIGY